MKFKLSISTLRKAQPYNERRIDLRIERADLSELKTPLLDLEQDYNTLHNTISNLFK